MRLYVQGSIMSDDVRLGGSGGCGSTHCPGTDDVSQEVLEVVTLREALRARAAAAISGRLSGSDIALLAGIGLVGAVPTLPEAVAHAPAGLRPLISALAQARAAADGPVVRAVLSAAFTNHNVPDLSAIIESMHSHGSAVGWLGAHIAESPASSISDTLVPDSADLFGVSATEVLADWVCRRRGWTKGQQIHHEAKALAYAVNGVIGACFGPNPIAFALAAWHGVKALRASSLLTRELEELARLAVQERQRLEACYDDTLRRSRVVDALVTALLGPAIPWTAEDQEREGARFLSSMDDPRRRGQS
jgi:hypothetical protein